MILQCLLLLLPETKFPRQENIVSLDRVFIFAAYKASRELYIKKPVLVLSQAGLGLRRTSALCFRGRNGSGNTNESVPNAGVQMRSRTRHQEFHRSDPRTRGRETP